ncbi:LytR/AlgR family response regulator transcription factor [Empedobacter sp. ULE_I145]|uniref:LytR/AlgR family response regulator transcription factor n=1 Tax=Empedobacter sp. R132-2 TaxID=2746740 RepID=UPI002576A488|nr:LytTR family DNA-binding domain-containing protein [Empedobacter sp. R132-2]MDM1137188.1 response regulator transcription factor [Empedobacter sp. R132-2]
MNCIIIDDEPLASEEMELLINEVSELEILGKFPNAALASKFLSTTQPDVIFLDIEMPLINGIEFAQNVPRNTLIIFTTAYSRYAIDSYELDAIDYLLKPIDKKRLEKAINKATFYNNFLTTKKVEENTVEENDDNFLFIKADRKQYKISFSEILFIEGLKDYVVLYTTTQKLITAMNLKTIHQKIDSEFFIRVSKSYIINSKHINSFDNHTIYMNEFEIPIGETYRSEFMLKYSKGN